MFGIFKKVEEEPVYTKEGEILYKLLKDEKEWEFSKEKLVNSSLTIYCIFHRASDIKINYTSSALCVMSGQSSDFCNIFSEDDSKRIMPLVKHVVAYLRNKPVRDALLKFSRSESEDNQNPNFTDLVG